MSVPVLSLSGREEIESYLEKQSKALETEAESLETETAMLTGTAEAGDRNMKEDTVRAEHSPLLLELLYCRQGCHMGDGVR